jgi:hypothetical protein
VNMGETNQLDSWGKNNYIRDMYNNAMEQEQNNTYVTVVVCRENY